MIAAQEAPAEYRTWATDGPTLLLPHRCLCHGGVEKAREEAVAIKAFWRAHNVRAVMAEYLQFAVQYIDLAKESGIRFYAHAHGFDCSALIKRQTWIARYRDLNKASGVIVVSNKMKEALAGIGVCADIIHSIPCGVEAKEFLTRPDRTPNIRFVAVGRLAGKKGPIFLLDSFRRALRENAGIELHVIGDGELMEAAIQFVQCFSLEGAVKFYGPQPPSAVQELMRECDVFVQHSVVSVSTGDEEGLPVVILEAMAAGLPVISTAHAGIPEAVIDGVTGFLVPERDTSAMSERMSALARNYHTRLEMGMKGLERIRAAFTWDHERRRLMETIGLSELS